MSGARPLASHCFVHVEAACIWVGGYGTEDGARTIARRMRQVLHIPPEGLVLAIGSREVGGPSATLAAPASIRFISEARAHRRGHSLDSRGHTEGGAAPFVCSRMCWDPMGRARQGTLLEPPPL